MPSLPDFNSQYHETQRQADERINRLIESLAYPQPKMKILLSNKLAIARIGLLVAIGALLASQTFTLSQQIERLIGRTKETVRLQEEQNAYLKGLLNVSKVNLEAKNRP